MKEKSRYIFEINLWLATLGTQYTSIVKIDSRDIFKKQVVLN